ncbi:hypothetical protein ACQEU3_24410 [Spirillospora sp. CA-253888]
MPPEPAEPPEPSEPSSALPLVLRPSRDALRWVLPVLAVSLAMLFVGRLYTGPGFLAVTMAGLALTLLQMRTLLLIFFGRTVLMPHEVRTRLVLHSFQVPLREVTRVDVVRRPSGRRIAVKAKRQRFLLAAPREMSFTADPRFDAVLEMLVARAGEAVEVRRPRRYQRLVVPAVILVIALEGLYQERWWLEPWWPTRHEATAVPDAWTVLDEAAAGRLMREPRMTDEHSRRDRDYAHQSSVWWHARGSLPGKVHLRYDMRIRSVLEESGTDEADETLARDADDDEAKPLSGLGDKAVLIDESDENGTDLKLVARRANVLVEVEYAGDIPAPRALAETEALARRALEKIVLR